ncbi:MAG: glycosyltransferase family 4 protein [Promethearchaeota archaeon]
MLKLLLFSPNSVEYGRGGEISSMELATGLNKYYDTIFVDTNVSPGERLLSKKAIEIKLNGVKKRYRIKYANFTLGNWIFSFPYPWEILNLYRRIKNTDIIYTSYSDLKNTILFILASLIYRRTNFIIGYRKPLYSGKFFSIYNLKYRASILLLSLFKKRIYHHALSNHAKKYLEQFYETEKVIYITHGIKLDDFIDDGMLKKNREVLNFLYVGHLIEIPKGFNTLLSGIKELLEENKNLKLHFEICGLGPLQSKLKELEKIYPEYIKYLGYISNEKISEIYKRNDVFLFSSRREPFPRVLMEALAGNLIVICSKTIGSVELLKKQDFAFFLNELTPKEFKEKIFEVYRLWEKNNQKFLELQNIAKKYVFDNFSHEIELKEFKALIDKILEG